jgi:hypothetical protein
MIEIDKVKIYSSTEIVKETKQFLEDERQGQTGLLCRWNKVNRTIGKSWKSGSYVIAGLSGSGKSYILRLLLNDFSSINPITIKDKHGNDFTITPHNKDYKYKENTKFIHFGYEMKPANEQIRALGDYINKSYSTLVQSEYDDTTKDYNILSTKEIAKIEYLLDNLIAKQNLWYIRTPLTIVGFKVLMIRLHKQYPNTRFVVTYDHALLTRKDPDAYGNQMLAMAEALGNAANRLAEQYNDTYIILNQMNTDIQTVARTSMPAKHYPGTNDGYGGNALYFAVDNYIYITRPNSYNITEYGLNKYKTSIFVTEKIIKTYKKIFNISDLNKQLDVIHFYPHKTRLSADDKETFLLMALHRGRIIPCPIELIMTQ